MTSDNKNSKDVEAVSTEASEADAQALGGASRPVDDAPPAAPAQAEALAVARDGEPAEDDADAATGELDPDGELAAGDTAEPSAAAAVEQAALDTNTQARITADSPAAAQGPTPPHAVSPGREEIVGRVGAWLRRTLGRTPFEVPDDQPTSGSVRSISSACVEAPGDERIADWGDEWEQPVTLDDPLTPAKHDRAVLLRNEPERWKNWGGLALVLLVCSLLYIPFAGSFGLWDPWETHYGEVSRHMTETNDWISPWWGSHWHRPDAAAEGAGFYSKPILVLWSMAIGMEIWGWSEFAIRIGVALMALFGVGLTFMMGASVWNRRTGFIMALVVGTSPFYFFLARQTQTDMPFVAMILCAMAFFVMGAFGKDRRKPADAVNYGIFIVALLALVVPQLVVIGSDQGFSDAQRAMRPGLREQSMNDFKGHKALEDVVMLHSPKISPAEREEIAQLGAEEAQARIEASRSAVPDFLLELGAPFFAVFAALSGIVLMLIFGFQGTLKARLMGQDRHRKTALALIAMALLSQALALLLHVKRLYDAYGANWEASQGAAFNVIKFSGVLCTLAMLGLLGWLFVVLLQGRDLERPRMRVRERRVAQIVALITLVLLISPILLVMKSKALGLDGVSFWESESFSLGRALVIVLGSVYAPIVLGLFLALWATVWLSAKSRYWETRTPIVLWSSLAALGAVIFLCVSVFYIPLTLDGRVATFGKVAGNVVGAVFQWGPTQIFLYLACIGIVLLSLRTSQRKTVGQLCFMGFYIFAALATMAKGLLGFALPGAIIFFYIVSTVEWRRLGEFEVPRGILVFTAVGVPWYAAMLILHENAYFQRFFVHDHFKRLASGVHQIDSGTFEHFIHWIGYGLFPWVALVPAAIIRLGAGRGLMLRDDRARATLIIAMWAAFSFTLFSLSSTKFHHYAFPVVPPLGMLVALLMADNAAGKMRRLFVPLAVSALVIVALVGWDLYQDPQAWKNLFTYKYDREWIDLIPEYTANIFGRPTLVRGAELHRSFQESALIVTIASSVGLMLMMAGRRWLRQSGLVVISLAALWLTVWGLDVYMPGISPTWSQKGVWMAYWDDCTKTKAPPEADDKKIWCEESALIYRITWRGEHYYSQNEAIPIQNDDDMKFFASYNGDTPFYFMVDRGRYCQGSATSPNWGSECNGNGSIVSEVRKHFPGKKVDHELIWDDNLKFIMVKFYPAGKPAPTEPASPAAGSTSALNLSARAPRGL